MRSTLEHAGFVLVRDAAGAPASGLCRLEKHGRIRKEETLHRAHPGRLGSKRVVARRRTHGHIAATIGCKHNGIDGERTA